jgi:hypothetical protein
MRIASHNFPREKKTYSPSTLPHPSRHVQDEQSLCETLPQPEQEVVETSHFPRTPPKFDHQKQIEIPPKPTKSTSKNPVEFKTTKPLTAIPKPFQDIVFKDSLPPPSVPFQSSHPGPSSNDSNTIQSFFETSASTSKATRSSTASLSWADHAGISTARGRIAVGVLVSPISNHLDKSVICSYECVAINDGSTLSNNMLFRSGLNETDALTSSQTLMSSTATQDTTAKLFVEGISPISPAKIAKILSGSPIGQNRLARAQRSISSASIDLS